MEIHIHIHHHGDEKMLSEIKSINSKLSNMANELDNLELEVKETTDLQQSAITLLNGLKTKLDEAIASGDMNKVVTLRDNLDASNTSLAAAITANTPAEGDPGGTV
jgi:hypothetical protein